MGTRPRPYFAVNFAARATSFRANRAKCCDPACAQMTSHRADSMVSCGVLLSILQSSVLQPRMAPLSERVGRSQRRKQ